MIDFFKKNIIFTVILALIILFAFMYLFDYARAKTFDIEILEITPDNPVADGETPVTISVRLSQNGKPVDGHYLYMFSLDGGTLRENRLKTDENGLASYTYYPYRSTILMPARTVTLRVYDEDNSIFVIVNAVTDFTIDLKERVS